MIKDYEFIGKQCAVLHLQYFGIDLKVEFTNGNTARSKGAEYSTNDRFTQDAIEHDSRFGKTIFLRNKYLEPGEEVKAAPAQKQEQAKEVKNGKTNKGDKNKGKEPECDENGKRIISDCRSMNDVIAYFKSLGENPEGDDDIRSLMEKHQVTFPSMSL